MAYIRIEHIDGERVYFLCDEDGEALIGSRYGQAALIQYAADRGLAICSVH